MSKKAIVHVGLDKTGTTTIQKALFRHRLALLERGILYPSWGWNHSMFLVALFAGRAPRQLPKAPNGATLEEARSQYQAMIANDLKTPFDKLILSGEALSGFNDEAIARLTEWLNEHVSDISVVVYVRHPVDWTRSWVQQRVKEGDILSDLYSNPRGPQWRARLSPWVERFGADAVTVVPFEKARKVGILSSFCRVAGIELPPDVDIMKENTSLTREAVEIVDCLNQHYFPRSGHSFDDRMKTVLGLTVPQGGEPYRLPAPVAEHAAELSQPDVEWINETFGLNLYAPPPGWPSHIPIGPY